MVASHTIAVFGGSFNPPGLHHRKVAEILAQRFSRVIIVPCGERPDRADSPLAPSHLRAKMVEHTFLGISGVEIDLFDIARSPFTRTWELEEMYRPRGVPWIVVGAEMVVGGRYNTSPIQRSWERGEALWQKTHFCVLTRPGFTVRSEDLPPNALLIEAEISGSSSLIRSAIARGALLTDLVTPEVEMMIETHSLYRDAR